MEFDLKNPFSILEESNQRDATMDLFAMESEYIPSRDFLCGHLAAFRHQAVALVSQAKCSSCDPYVAYLAVNYVDRFISKKRIMDAKPWFHKLTVAACISLASKMTNSRVSTRHLQGFDNRSVNRMETIILEALDWRMRSITPLSFFPYLFTLMKLDDELLESALQNRAMEAVLESQREMKMLEFKPSEIAASAIWFAQRELTSGYSVRSVFCGGWIDDDKMEACVKVLEEVMRKETYESSLESDSSSFAGKRESADSCGFVLNGNSHGDESDEDAISTITDA